MATIIQIKRSSGTSAPSTLKLGELAYTYGTGTQGNLGDRLFVGEGGVDDEGNANNITVIGGQYFTDQLDHAQGTLTASSALLVDSNKAIDEIFIGNDASTGGTLKLNEGTNNGTNFIGLKAPNSVTTSTTFTLPDGDGSNGQFLKTDGSGNLSFGTVSSTITLAADSGDNDTYTTGSTLTFTGGTGSDTKVSDDTMTSAVDSTIATASSTTTFTNKTFDANGTGNSITNIEVADLASGVLDTDLSSVAVTDTTLASAKAIKAYVDSQITAVDVDIAGDTGTGAITDAETLTFTGGTGIDTTVSGNEVSFAIDSTVTTNSGTQTLTNKTIDASSNTLSNIGNSSLSNSTISISDDSSSSTNIPLGGGFSILGGTGITSTVNGSELTLEVDSTITTNSGTQTLTNKTIDLGSNTLTGTTAEFNSALQDNSFATLAGTETLTNKTINSASNTITITESNISDLGSYITASSTDTLTNKTIDAASNTLSNIGNSSLTNSSITVTDGSTSTATSLGGTITFNGTTNEIEVGESSGTITVGLPNDVTIGNDLTVTGDLTVNGTTTTVNSTTIEITNSFTFEGSTADANETVLGVIVPTADRTINLPNASGTIVLQDTTDTLTNKTIDASNNTISNIGDSELSSGISATKIGNGDVDNTELSYLNGVTSSIQTQIDTKASTAFAIAQAVALG